MYGLLSLVFIIIYSFFFLLLTEFFIQFASEESQDGPLILFLKDVEKMCGNSYSYHGLKNKLEIFPAGVFIIGSQTQTDTRKDKVLLVKIIYTQLFYFLISM